MPLWEFKSIIITTYTQLIYLYDTLSLFYSHLFLRLQEEAEALQNTYVIQHMKWIDHNFVIK